MLSKVLRRATLNNTIHRQAARSFGVWGHVDQAPADPILGLNDAFKADSRSEKVLLGMGAYRDDAGAPYILDCVRQAERAIVDSQMGHEYSSIDGIPTYREKCVRLAYGEDSVHAAEGRVVSCQSISGTGSLRVGLDFMR
jgi:aspartate aminotransferase